MSKYISDKQIKNRLIDASVRETPDFWGGIAGKIPGTQQVETAMKTGINASSVIPDVAQIALVSSGAKRRLNILWIAEAAATILIVSVLVVFITKNGALNTLFGNRTGGSVQATDTAEKNLIVINIQGEPDLVKLYNRVIHMPPPRVAGDSDIKTKGSTGLPAPDDTLNGKWKELFGAGALPDEFPEYIVWAQYDLSTYIELGSNAHIKDPGRGFVIYFDGSMFSGGEYGTLDAYNKFMAYGYTPSMINSTSVIFTVKPYSNSEPEYVASFVYLDREYLVYENGITEDEFVDFIRSIVTPSEVDNTVLP